MATALITSLIPSLDEVILDYLEGYLDEDEDPVATFVRPLLECEGIKENQINDVCNRLDQMLANKRELQKSDQDGPKTLDQAVHMRSQAAMSKTGLMGGAIDIESTVKARDSRVDVTKLAKAEAKLKAKREKKKDKFVEFEESRLVKAREAQKSYEELFLEVNPLNAAALAKGKTKDIHVDNIELNFGSNKILSGAKLDLAYGRRYGLIGRNGVGKSTLLRNMALREVAIPSHITILYVEQEVVGDETRAIDSVLKADVWRDRLLAEEAELNALLSAPDAHGNSDTAEARAAVRDRELATIRLGEVHQLLVDIDAETGPSRAAELLAGLGFSTEDQARPTKAFSGGWRMRLSLARALFCRPDLLLLDEPSNNLDLNALAWLEDYLQTWPGSLLVVSHDRAFLDEIATDIIHQHSQRLDYYKGNFTQFYATKSERAKNQRREYESQLQYRQHLQAFIDRWRYNANRAAQAQSKIKILEKLPELEPPEDDDVVHFKFAPTDKLTPPLLQLEDCSFGYSADKPILKHVNIDVTMESRMGLIGPNGAGKSTLLKLLIGDLQPIEGRQHRNSRLRISYFSQHHVDQLDLNLSPVSFLAARMPGKSDQEYRQHLGSFGLTGLTGLQQISTLSGGQKSRVAFALLSLQQPHILVLDEPTNHLDIEGLDALMDALSKWNGGVIVVSHDSRFIHNVCKELWVVASQKAEKFVGDVSAYKSLIVANQKTKPT
ncbi:hypothetical protein PtA15_5A429 [Puccinia triticina]|uniref:ABC transporter domain-containing protein n=1 Tax=Puccinia triticina TaxID=208348 RepID=A0ABY7CI03_9BASI|nr:uncharacterized protein PtA15_5A429 [Puccinia triticina]WAQ84856.1 hypothetical protein PtA15_5A429 [Puccinia triticina]WAR58204.1 hypothetical protein PtB15_5B436 [Puccinia triticina]